MTLMPKICHTSGTAGSSILHSRYHYFFYWEVEMFHAVRTDEKQEVVDSDLIA